MANSDKNIVITPNTGEANDPTIILTGGGNVPITIKSLDDSFGTVQFEGSNGSLFSINNNLSNGSLFNVNDGAGMPVMDIQEDGTVRFGGKISFPASSIPDGSITREKLSEDAQRVETSLQEAVRNKQDWFCTFRLTLENNKVKYMIASGTCISDEYGNVIKVVGGNFDVTELREAQERLVTLKELTVPSANPVTVTGLGPCGNQ